MADDGDGDEDVRNGFDGFEEINFDNDTGSSDSDSAGTVDVFGTYDLGFIYNKYSEKQLSCSSVADADEICTFCRSQHNIRSNICALPNVRQLCRISSFSK